MQCLFLLYMYTGMANDCSCLYRWTAREVWVFLLGFLSQKSDSQHLLSWATVRLGKFHSDFFFWVDKKLVFFNISKCLTTPTRADALSSVQDHHPLFYQVQSFVSTKLTHCHRSAPHTKVTGQSLNSDNWKELHLKYLKYLLCKPLLI